MTIIGRLGITAMVIYGAIACGASTTTRLPGTLSASTAVPTVLPADRLSHLASDPIHNDPLMRFASRVENKKSASTEVAETTVCIPIYMYGISKVCYTWQ
jgi:hypothetical protein